MPILHAQANHPVSAHSTASGLKVSGYVCDLLQAVEPSAKHNQKNLKRERKEYALGSKLAADVENNVDLIADEHILQYLNALEQTITTDSTLPGCFVVKLLHDPEPNAYSLPGGFIYVTTGLIYVTTSEGELVSALAHETGHVTARHLTTLNARTRTWRRLALLGGPAGYALRRYVGPLMTLKLVRDKEFEADQLGLRYEIASGYDPAEFIKLLHDALADVEREDSFLDGLSSTHPSTKTRVERLQSTIRVSAACQTACVVSTNEFAEMKDRLTKVIAERHDE